MKVTILAIAGGAKRHLLEEQAQKDTWANSSEDCFNIFWIHGRPELIASTLDSGRRLLVPVAEEYSKLLDKRIYSLEWALENAPADFYVLTNCSGYIDLPSLSELCLRLPKSDLYTGPAGDGYIQGKGLDELGQYYVGGGFVIISADVARCLSYLNPAEFGEMSDDLAMGLWLQQNGISAKPLYFCNLSYGDYLKKSTYTRIRHLTRPKVTINRMNEVHRYFIQNSYSKITQIREIWRLLNEALPHQFSLRRALYEIRVLNSRPN